ncbi:MAG: hypothetical protein A2428_10160 [Bdellovibrionales bacterium RIFOXYC1_FULL_54_43]|nr:MAG: hypothetical protein A2428_10160 [Bdellovibrionales bacterium RIFOXYC1_FULL_54_43]
MSKTEIAIRDVSIADARNIAQIHTKTWQATYRGIIPDEFLDAMSEDVATPRFTRIITDHRQNRPECPFLVAILDNAIVGFADGVRPVDAPAEYDCEIKAIYVDPLFQQRGAGRALVRESARRFSERGFRGMIIWAAAENPWRRFYERIGGQLLPLDKEMEIGGKAIPHVAYGWSDLPALVTRLSLQPETSISMRLLSGEPVEMEELQAVMEAVPNYAHRMTGVPPGKSDSLSTFSELPPGIGYDDKFVFGVYQRNRMVGCVDLIRGYPNVEIAMLGLLLLREDCQGQGLGKATFALVEDYVRKWESVRKIRIGVARINDIVLPFWKKQGFKETGEIKPYRYHGLVDSEIVILEKLLR